MKRVLLLGGILCLISFALAPSRVPAQDEDKPSDAAKIYRFLIPGAAKDAKEESKAKEEPKTEAKKTVEKPAEKPAAKKLKVVRFTLKGSYPEGPESVGLFSDTETSLQTIVDHLDQAAEDKAVSAVWLRIEGLDIGRAKIGELRAAIARIRKAGKPVWAELASAESAEYLLAGACDEIVMAPSGTLIIPGVRAEVTFYKGLLDKLGVQFDMLQMGKFKGAAEPLTRTNMSPALKESMEALVDDTYNEMVAVISADRKLKDYQVKSLLDAALFTAEAAQKAKLVDQLLYADQLQDALGKRLKAGQIEVITDYKNKKVEIDLSGISGMFKLMELLMGSKPAEKVSKTKKIAIVYAVGEIVEGKSGSSLLGTSSVGSTTIVDALKKAADDPTVAAIVLRIDSPGGSAVGSDLIWRETVSISKPLIASMGDTAGSGGYYIAMGAKKIIAAPGTLTGSIGVVGGKLVLQGLYNKVGLSTEVISRGALSGSLSDLEPFSPEQRAAWTALLQETYNQFVTKAAEGRKLTFQELDSRAQGRVYSGRMAKEYKLIDELGTLKDAIAEAKKAANLKPGEPVELLILPRSQGILEQLLGGETLGGEMDSAMPELMRPLRQAKLWRRMLEERTLLWMPYDVKIR
jgi:protease IV